MSPLPLVNAGFLHSANIIQEYAPHREPFRNAVKSSCEFAVPELLPLMVAFLRARSHPTGSTDGGACSQGCSADAFESVDFYFDEFAQVEAAEGTLAQLSINAN